VRTKRGRLGSDRSSIRRHNTSRNSAERVCREGVLAGRSPRSAGSLSSPEAMTSRSDRIARAWCRHRPARGAAVDVQEYGAPPTPVNAYQSTSSAASLVRIRRMGHGRESKIFASGTRSTKRRHSSARPRVSDLPTTISAACDSVAIAPRRAPSRRPQSTGVSFSAIAASLRSARARQIWHQRRWTARDVGESAARPRRSREMTSTRTRCIPRSQTVGSSRRRIIDGAWGRCQPRACAVCAAVRVDNRSSRSRLSAQIGS